MPTLCFDHNFSKIEKRILSKTFHQNCRDLGISKVDASIELRRIPMESEKHLGCVIHLHPVDAKRFIMLLNNALDIRHNVFVLGHEMVHVHQHMRGDMLDLHDTQEVIWKGKRFPAAVCENRLFYEHLPWEKEAFAKQDGLLQSAIRCLDREEAIYCVRDMPDLPLAA